MLFELALTEIWMISVTTTPQHYAGFSGDTKASLSRDQARFKSPLVVACVSV